MLSYLKEWLQMRANAAPVWINLRNNGVPAHGILYALDEHGAVIALDATHDQRCAYPWTSILWINPDRTP